MYCRTLILLLCVFVSQNMYSSAAYSQGFAKALSLLHVPSKPVVSDRNKKQNPSIAPLTVPVLQAAQAPEAPNPQEHAQLLAAQNKLLQKQVAQVVLTASASANTKQEAATALAISDTSNICDTPRIEQETFFLGCAFARDYAGYLTCSTWPIPTCKCPEPKFGVANTGPCSTQQERLRALNNYLHGSQTGRFCCAVAGCTTDQLCNYIIDFYGHYIPHEAVWPSGTDQDMFNAQLATFQLNFQKAEMSYKKYWAKNLKTSCSNAVSTLRPSSYDNDAPTWLVYKHYVVKQEQFKPNVMKRIVEKEPKCQHSLKEDGVRCFLYTSPSGYDS